MDVRENERNSLIVQRAEIPHETTVAPEMVVEPVFERSHPVGHCQNVLHSRYEAHLRGGREGVQSRGDEFVERDDEAGVPIDGRDLVQAAM